MLVELPKQMRDAVGLALCLVMALLQTLQRLIGGDNLVLTPLEFLIAGGQDDGVLVDETVHGVSRFGAGCLERALDRFAGGGETLDLRRRFGPSLLEPSTGIAMLVVQVAQLFLGGVQRPLKRIALNGPLTKALLRCGEPNLVLSFRLGQECFGPGRLLERVGADAIDLGVEHSFDVESGRAGLVERSLE